MTPFERRLSRLEAAHNMRFQSREVFVIYDDDEADIHPGSLRYKRMRDVDETPADFERRIMSEAGKLGSQLITMTRQEFNEIAAEIEKEFYPVNALNAWHASTNRFGGGSPGSTT